MKIRKRREPKKENKYVIEKKGEFNAEAKIEKEEAEIEDKYVIEKKGEFRAEAKIEKEEAEIYEDIDLVINVNIFSYNSISQRISSSYIRSTVTGINAPYHLQRTGTRMHGVSRYGERSSRRELSYIITPRKVGNIEVKVPFNVKQKEYEFVFNIKVNPSEKYKKNMKRINMLENDIKQGMELSEVTNLLGTPKSINENMFKHEKEIIYKFKESKATYSLTFVSNTLRDMISSESRK